MKSDLKAKRGEIKCEEGGGNGGSKGGEDEKKGKTVIEDCKFFPCYNSLF